MFREEVVEKQRFWATTDLKEKRKQANLTMEAIAKYLGCSKGYYCRIENSLIPINAETYKKISFFIKRKDAL